jgi:thiol-disulfide isomerase/thioredoxin
MAVRSRAVATRRLPLIPVVVATVVALAAASGIFVLLGDSDDQSGAQGSAEDSQMQLSPAGDLPESTEDVVLGGLDGGPERRLGELLGERPVVLNFFASWCVPCMREMPAFEAVHQDLGDQVTFLGMANRDDPDQAREMVERTGVTYPTFADPESSAITYFGGMVMPTTVFIDASGEVLEVASEELTEDELRRKIDDLLGVAS